MGRSITFLMLCSLCFLLLLCIEGRAVTLAAVAVSTFLRRCTWDIECSSCTSASYHVHFPSQNQPLTSSQNYSISTRYFWVSPVSHFLFNGYLTKRLIETIACFFKKSTGCFLLQNAQIHSIAPRHSIEACGA